MEAADIKGLLGLLLVDGSLNQYRTPRGGYVQLTLTGGVTEAGFLAEKVDEFRQFIPTKAEIVPYRTAPRFSKRGDAHGVVDAIKPRTTTVLRFRVSTNKLRPVYNLLYPDGNREITQNVLDWRSRLGLGRRRTQSQGRLSRTCPLRDNTNRGRAHQPLA